MINKISINEELKEDIDLFLCRLYECFEENNFEPYKDLRKIPDHYMCLLERVSIAYMMIDSHLNDKFELDIDEIVQYEQTYEKGITILEKMLDKKPFLDFLKMCEFESLREPKLIIFN